MNKQTTPSKHKTTPKKALHSAAKPTHSVKRTPVTKENTPKPTQQDKSEQHVVKKVIQLNATPNEVWEALTNPEKTKKYFFNCAVYSDWKPGSPITFKGKIFFFWPIELHGEIVKIEPQKMLKYNLRHRAKGKAQAGISVVTDQLSYANGITTLSITDDVGKGDGAVDRYNRSVKGWDKILSGLKKLVEKK